MDILSIVLGIFIGFFLSLIAIVTGKKYSENINDPYVSSKKAEIIKKKDIIDEITQ